MRRSAVSVPSNIAEGKGRYSRKELLQFLFHARGSLLELRTQITIAKNFGQPGSPLPQPKSFTVDGVDIGWTILPACCTFPAAPSGRGRSAVAGGGITRG